MVEIRRACFEAERHRRAVHFDECATGQVKLRVMINEPVELVVRRRVGQHPGDVTVRIDRVTRDTRLVGQQLVLFRRRKSAHQNLRSNVRRMGGGAEEMAEEEVETTVASRPRQASDDSRGGIEHAARQPVQERGPSDGE